MKRIAIAAGSLAALLTVAACGSSSGGDSSSPPPTATSSSASQPAGGAATSSATTKSGPKITIKNFAFSGTMTVKPGAKVTVVNNDSTAHTLTDKKTHAFDTGNIAAGGATGTFTAPTKPGKYPFGCTYHPEMAGTLTVQG